MFRYCTGEEIAELFKRAKLLLDTQGVDESKDPHGTCNKSYSNKELMVQIRLDDNGLMYVEDSVAGVMTACYETGGIRECFGSTAKNVLVKLRKAMILEDLAGV